VTDKGLQSNAAPGEAYYLMKAKSSLVIHVVAIIFWSFLGSLQFVPSIRKSFSHSYHKVAGYLYLILSIIVASSGLGMLSVAFGANFAAQVGTFILCILFVICGVMGYISIKSKNRNIQAHRDWMIRMFSIGTSVITTRVFTPIGLIVSSKLGLHTTMKCEAITHSLGDVMTQQNFPSCGSPIDLSKVVAVQANFHTNSNVSAGIQIGFSVGVLPAVLLHIIVAEYWIQTRFYSIKVNQEIIMNMNVNLEMIMNMNLNMIMNTNKI
jgi:hypothetical protein